MLPASSYAYSNYDWSNTGFPRPFMQKILFTIVLKNHFSPCMSFFTLEWKWTTCPVWLFCSVKFILTRNISPISIGSCANNIYLKEWNQNFILLIFSTSFQLDSRKRRRFQEPLSKLLGCFLVLFLIKLEYFLYTSHIFEVDKIMLLRLERGKKNKIKEGKID